MMLKKKILVVEDNLLNREMLVEFLVDQYTVLQAENGSEALDILRNNKGDIALILLDVMMPVMDGYTFLDRVKEDDELSLIPVIVTTQSGSEMDEVAALTHGATDFVPKPYRPEVIRHRVASLIKLRETAAMVNQFQYDRLTGLYSKEFFYRKVRERLDENPEREYTIVCSDIENFKLYNDTFGRKAGDSLLRESAENMRSLIGEDGICGRYGADCFLCLQQREKERADRKHFLDAEYTKRPAKIKNVSIKWGIYEIADRSIPIEQMCDRALLAANSVKGQYDTPFAVYDDALRGKLLREKVITDAMESALAEGQFTVYFQPKYSLSDGCMTGAEALVRWNHPEWGFMSPGEFIPLFEKNGFISFLDQYVWERVCSLLSDWKEKGYPILPVSVNVSRADVYRADLTDILLGLTQKYGVDPAYLHLEITESAYAENTDQIVSTMEELKKLGFIIEMDDFGSGYSSLNMLSRMKVDILKLDMKFIRNETAKPAAQSILNDIINMAHRMHLSVVAEGVETGEQVKRLQTVGCDYAQGYFFAKPMPVAEFEELWKAEHSRAQNLLPKASQMKPGMHRLLVIDEDAGYREKVRKTFDGQYEVTEASDADSAIACLKACGNDEISAVLLSTALPEDGAASILKMMRQTPAFWKIPVLAIIPSSERIEELPLTQETDDFVCKWHPLFDLYRRVQRLVDIAESHKRESTLQNEAHRDYLTGLLNRRGFKAAIASLRADELPLTICLFDLDDLKKVNDTYGHDTGDRIIQAFADLLRHQTRAEDIQCRYGGDEFIVVLKHLNNAETAIQKGTEICQLFHDCLEEEQLPSSCSGGIVLCTSADESSDKLIERADRALYRAKHENKGGCCLGE